MTKIAIKLEAPATKSRRALYTVSVGGILIGHLERILRPPKWFAFAMIGWMDGFKPAGSFCGPGAKHAAARSAVRKHKRINK